MWVFQERRHANYFEHIVHVKWLVSSRIPVPTWVCQESAVVMSMHTVTYREVPVNLTAIVTPQSHQLCPATCTCTCDIPVIITFQIAYIVLLVDQRLANVSHVLISGWSNLSLPSGPTLPQLTNTGPTLAIRWQWHTLCTFVYPTL